MKKVLGRKPRRREGRSTPAIALLICVFLAGGPIQAAEVVSAAHFQVMPLGTSGGELEDNLSAYLVAPIDSNKFVALDAGTLCSSIKKITVAQLKKMQIAEQPSQSLQEVFFKQHIKAYLLSHAHLDHISGLIICSTIDSKKGIMGTESTINYLRDNIFNWKIWPNFADEGAKPLLKNYHYHRIDFKGNNTIPGTTMTVKAFPLSHGNGYPSTAFLLESKGFYLLYVGDTGADPLEKSQDLNQLWRAIAPLIKARKLTAIFIESSYPNSQPPLKLFGHLTPHWLLVELRELALAVDPQHPQQALSGLKIIVTHIKQGLESENNAEVILQELNTANDLKVHFIIPQTDSPLYM